jgi:hypothetical protein
MGFWNFRRSSSRNPDGEPAADYFSSIVNILLSDPPLVRFDDRTAQRQADAQAVAFGAEKRLVQSRLHLRRQAPAGVADPETDGILSIQAIDIGL